jgi:transcriptional regulator with XRE-family HTH domain/mannose-6-phosphate isomerase-like protein (cupin superfamily)
MGSAETLAEPVVNLGGRLRDVRLRSGLSLREVARQLSVSPSFVSQLENGKSQPSVATLYAMSQLLDVSIDELFAVHAADDGTGVPQPLHAVLATRDLAHAPPADGPSPVSRSDFSSPVDAFPRDGRQPRVSHSRPGERPRLEMDTGVIWERLAANTGVDLDFLEIVYPPHSSSTNDGRMMQHAGSEFGYLLEGELEVTVGFDTFTLHAGEALGFESFQPHLFRNLGEAPARGIWFVRHPHS